MHVAESAGRAWENERKKMGAPGQTAELQDATLASLAWGGFDRMTKNGKGCRKPPSTRLLAACCLLAKNRTGQTEREGPSLASWLTDPTGQLNRQAVVVRLRSEASEATVGIHIPSRFPVARRHRRGVLCVVDSTEVLYGVLYSVLGSAKPWPDFEFPVWAMARGPLELGTWSGSGSGNVTSRRGDSEVSDQDGKIPANSSR